MYLHFFGCLLGITIATHLAHSIYLLPKRYINCNLQGQVLLWSDRWRYSMIHGDIIFHFSSKWRMMRACRSVKVIPPELLPALVDDSATTSRCSFTDSCLVIFSDVSHFFQEIIYNPCSSINYVYVLKKIKRKSWKIKSNEAKRSWGLC